MDEYLLPFILWNLKRDLMDLVPDDDIIVRAQSIMRCYPREDLPDWVEIIANGDPENMAAVVEIAISDIESEGNDASNF